MADVVGPGDISVGLARERCALQARQLGEVAFEVGGSERAEVAADSALALDNHQPLLLAFELVDLHGLEEIRGVGREDSLAAVAEAAGEVVDVHNGAVDSPVVAGEEEIHVLLVANDG